MRDLNFPLFAEPFIGFDPVFCGLRRCGRLLAAWLNTHPLVPNAERGTSAHRRDRGSQSEIGSGSPRLRTGPVREQDLLRG